MRKYKLISAMAEETAKKSEESWRRYLNTCKVFILSFIINKNISSAVFFRLGRSLDTAEFYLSL